jgi:hypothetical protein
VLRLTGSPGSLDGRPHPIMCFGSLQTRPRGQAEIFTLMEHHAVVWLSIGIYVLILAASIHTCVVNMVTLIHVSRHCALMLAMQGGYVNQTSWLGFYSTTIFTVHDPQFKVKLNPVEAFRLVIYSSLGSLGMLYTWLPVLLTSICTRCSGPSHASRQRLCTRWK